MNQRRQETGERAVEAPALLEFPDSHFKKHVFVADNDADTLILSDKSRLYAKKSFTLANRMNSKAKGRLRTSATRTNESPH